MPHCTFREIELIHKLSKGGAASLSAIGEKRAALSLTEVASRQPIRDESWSPRTSFAPQPEDLTEEDEIVLQRWKERDKQFDAQVAQI